MAMFDPQGVYPGALTDDQYRVPAQLGTLLGFQLMRPEYGFNFPPFVDRAYDPSELSLVQKHAEEGFKNLDGSVTVRPSINFEGMMVLAYELSP